MLQETRSSGRTRRADPRRTTRSQARQLRSSSARPEQLANAEPSRLPRTAWRDLDDPRRHAVVNIRAACSSIRASTSSRRRQSTLRTIAKEIASEYPGADIRIDGFTDTDRITTNKYKTNYLGLSVRIRSDSSSSAGHRTRLGRLRLVRAAHAKSTKAASRRVEIAVIR